MTGAAFVLACHNSRNIKTSWEFTGTGREEGQPIWEFLGIYLLEVGLPLLCSIARPNQSGWSKKTASRRTMIGILLPQWLYIHRHGWHPQYWSVVLYSRSQTRTAIIGIDHHLFAICSQDRQLLLNQSLRQQGLRNVAGEATNLSCTYLSTSVYAASGSVSAKFYFFAMCMDVFLIVIRVYSWYPCLRGTSTKKDWFLVPGFIRELSTIKRRVQWQVSCIFCFPLYRCFHPLIPCVNLYNRLPK